MKYYIRPVYNYDERLISLALCTTNLEILVDSQIVEQFPPNSRGVDIREVAADLFGIADDAIDWGKNIYVSR